MQIKLLHPVLSDGTELRVLSLRRPKVRDLLLAAKLGDTDEEREVRMFANLCEVPPETIEELDVADYRALQEEYRAFFEKDGPGR